MDNGYERTRYIPRAEREKAQKQLPSMKKPACNCESCEHYDYDEYTDSMECKMSLDEDEMRLFVSGIFSSCPYYKYYDEYKSVHKQI